ncbi:FAD-binding domain-containing protein [Crucibulum laeve]|uniref:FAD-binding domain-containing protein n=1 Tax=Crucibulum laeve TaxID=68775 RepID=A0A5C3LSQ3_9AGAR|nr:FAD-binding domain-containing protein [Crucibulum laeve]
MMGFNLTSSFLLTALLGVFGTVVSASAKPTIDPICFLISKAASSATDVYYPGSPDYIEGISHYANRSSTQISKCVVEPGTAQDVGTIMKIIGAARVPFAVIGGGHATNPGFSSTTGIHIEMRRFSKVVYDNTKQTATIGAGLIWDDVYAALEPYNVKVAGGRVTGIGVAGFILGGGYSWLTNQHGLAIDTVQGFELVTPEGKILTVTQSLNPDLFFGLKGGSNNFGIVTSFTLRTFPQAQIWGGIMYVDGSQMPQVTAAVSTFSANATDPKAALLASYVSTLGQLVITLLFFYDGMAPPTGIFDDLLAIPSFVKDVRSRSYLSLVQSGGDVSHDQRSIYHTISPLQLTPALSDVILNETVFWGAQLGPKSAFAVAYAIEPFLPTIYSHNTTPTAFPPTRSIPFLPFNIWYSWNVSSFDNDFHTAARQSAAHIRAAAISQGQLDIAKTPLYPNYAIFDTPLKDIYGSNLPRLRSIKARIDPRNVMGLAGGFKL